MKNTLFHASLSTIKLSLGLPFENGIKIAEQIKKAESQGAKLAVFPELSLTGYTCADLFLTSKLIDNCKEALSQLLAATKSCDIFAFVGMPLEVSNRLYNCAVGIFHGEVLGVLPKTYIPNYGEYYESRYFSSALDTNTDTVEMGGVFVPFGSDLIFDCIGIEGLSLTAEICEDLWAPVSPSTRNAVNGATVICNLSASNDFAGKKVLRASLIEAQSEKLKCNYLYVSSGFGESSTDLSFGGDKIVGELGVITARDTEDSDMLIFPIDTEKACAMRRKSDTFKLNVVKSRHISFGYAAVPEENYSGLPENPFFLGKNEDNCKEIFDKQIGGLATRLRATGIKKMVIGVSGGIDSTLALLVCKETAKQLDLPEDSVIGITMPCFGTTKNSLNNSKMLMNELKIDSKEIVIKDVVTENLNLIGHSFKPDITYENAQARQRTQLLFNYANQIGGLCVGTSDLSEIALGFSTYGGDQMAMYNVNCSVPKTVCREIIRYYGEISGGKLKGILHNVIHAMISPELTPLDAFGEGTQSTEEIVGSYELIDFILYYHVKYGFSKEKIAKMLFDTFHASFSEALITNAVEQYFSRFYKNQFKRSSMPDGIKATEISLSPRGDFRMPSDIDFVNLNK